MRLPLLIVFACFCIVQPVKPYAQVNVQDSLALVDFFDSTYGPKWSRFVQPWDLNNPVKTWTGVTVSGDRVTGIELYGAIDSGRIPSSFGNLTALTRIYMIDNKITEATLPPTFKNLVNLKSLTMAAVFWYLPFPTVVTELPNVTFIDFQTNLFTDSIPSSIGNLTQLEGLELSTASLEGAIPSSMGNLKKLKGLNLNNNDLTGKIPDSFAGLDSLRYVAFNDNQLSGPVPLGLLNIDSLSGMSLENNRFDFGDIESFLTANSGNLISATYAPQTNIPITRQNNKLFVSPGGTPANNTFKWYRQGTGLVQTVNGDSTFTPSQTGTYYVEVTNSVATDLTLKSDPIDFKLILANAPITDTRAIAGTAPNNIQQGFIEIATLTPTGTTPLNGTVTTSIFLDNSVNTYNGVPYVQRHYDIAPANNASTSEATITLYFLQSEFDAYNDFVTSNSLGFPLMPTGGVDNGNMRISQFHGSFSGSSAPGGYANQNAVLITPTVLWKAANAWWEVTFPVSGFSGFFLSTATAALPVTLLEFKGQTVEKSIALFWTTVNETATKEFIIERSSDLNSFEPIGIVKASSNSGSNYYEFTDPLPLSGKNYYRLKMTEKDGKSSYSNIFSLEFIKRYSVVNIYPNPARDRATISFLSDMPGSYMLRISDQSGKQIQTLSGNVIRGNNKVLVDLNGFAKGTYLITLMRDGVQEKTLRLTKH